MNHCMPTTMDNKFNPFTHFDEWLAFDMHHHYNTLEVFSYFFKGNNELDDEQYNEEANKAIDRMLELNPLGIHVKLYEDDADTFIPLINDAYKQFNEHTDTDS